MGKRECSREARGRRVRWSEEDEEDRSQEGEAGEAQLVVYAVANCGGGACYASRGMGWCGVGSRAVMAEEGKQRREGGSPSMIA